MAPVAVHRQAGPEPIDPIDDEIARVLADPRVRSDLDEYVLQREAGSALDDAISHNEVRRHLGFDEESEPAVE